MRLLGIFLGYPLASLLVLLDELLGGLELAELPAAAQPHPAQDHQCHGTDHANHHKHLAPGVKPVGAIGPNVAGVSRRFGAAVDNAQREEVRDEQKEADDQQGCAHPLVHVLAEHLPDDQNRDKSEDESVEHAQGDAVSKLAANLVADGGGPH